MTTHMTHGEPPTMHKPQNFMQLPTLFAAAFLAACSSGPNHTAWKLGGTIEGLKGTGLTLQFNGRDELTIEPGATTFQFHDLAADGWPYEVTVLQDPTNPSQTCKVESGSGTTNGADITSVAVTCITNTYTVGGSVTHLLGNEAGLVLQLDDGGEMLAVDCEGKFAFPGKLESGASYTVEVAQQPTKPAQTCSFVNESGSGTVGGADIDSVAVDCSSNPFTVSFSVQGLTGSGLEVTLNEGTAGAETLGVQKDGKFSFETELVGAATYDVKVTKPPTNPSQTCSPLNGTGIGEGVDVTGILIICSANAYTVGGRVEGLLSTGLVLRLNGQNPLTLDAPGDFSFPVKIASGAQYAITVEQSPTGQTCTTNSSGSGTVGSADVSNVLVKCSCSTGLQACSGHCVDVAKDSANCGTCGLACAAPTTCFNSKCGCPGTQTPCANACVDTTTDNANCGRCGSACKGAEMCSESSCKVRYTWTNDVVTDLETGLTWQRNIVLSNSPNGSYSWDAAIGFCNQLGKANLGGFSNWRMPTFDELKSIVDMSRKAPAINVEAFPICPSVFFWTSSPYQDNADSVWIINFTEGWLTEGSRFAIGYPGIRCVR